MGSDERGLITDDPGTPPPPVPMREMDEAEFRRFVNMLLWLVIDEAEPLAAFGEAWDETLSGRKVRWGPWPTADCALVLGRWFDAGLLVIADLDGPYPADRARELIEAPDRWRPGTSPSMPYVGATDLGAATVDAGWLQVLDGLGPAGRSDAPV